MMNKKVLFVELKDITNIPAGKEHREDYLDYRVKYDFVKKLCENEELIRVNILRKKAVQEYKNLSFLLT